jgi:hypothetical protein
MVETLATVAIEEARKGRAIPREYLWSEFLAGPDLVASPSPLGASGNDGRGATGATMETAGANVTPAAATKGARQ